MTHENGAHVVGIFRLVDILSDKGLQDDDALMGDGKGSFDALLHRDDDSHTVLDHLGTRAYPDELLHRNGRICCVNKESMDEESVLGIDDRTFHDDNTADEVVV